MNKSLWFKTFVLFTIFSHTALAQGPPITSDKPIMLGANSVVIKTLTEIRATERGTFTKIPLMGHYLPTSNSLVGLYVPLVIYNESNENESGQSLGDIELVGKYQFYRKDKTGKTFRAVAKTIQTLPTGKKLDVPAISTGNFQSYLALVTGYETLKYGISNEIGYNFVPNQDTDEIIHKFGFGLPLLKPTYPVNQLNLYFEYQSNWLVEQADYSLLYAQGIQYAKGRLTMEVAIQFPLIQTLPESMQRKYSLFLGTRYVF